VRLGKMSEETKAVVKKEETGAVEAASMPITNIPGAMKKLENIAVDTIMFNPQVFAGIEKLAAIMASSRCMIPAHLTGNVGDCFAVIMQAIQWRMNPFAVAQKTHIIKGTLGYEAQLVNAVVLNCGAIKGNFEYDFFGPWENVIGKFKLIKGQNGRGDYHAPDWTDADEKGCGLRVTATIKATSRRETLELLLSQATVRNSTLWASDPKQQLAYLAVKKWARLYYPGAILGVYTPDELEEIEAPEKNVTPSKFQMPKTKKEKSDNGGNVPPRCEPSRSADGKEDAPTGKTQTGEHRFGAEDLPPTQDGFISGEQLKRLWTIIRKSGVNEENLKSGLRVFFGVESTKEIPVGKYDEICKWVEANCPEPSKDGKLI